MFEGNVSFPTDIMTTQEAARYIVKSDAYLRANYQRLGIKAYRVGNQLRFRRSELDTWLEGQVV
ncbi:MAG: Helix-turn-helix domain [Actinomycetota bacterium]|jgi:excisionase family DNA binding protein